MKIRYQIVLFFFIAMAMSVPFFVFADQSSLQGLSITPFIFVEHLQKGDSIERNVILTNHTPDVLQISASINDFSAGKDQQPIFSAVASDPKFSLSSWMKIKSAANVVLESGQSAAFTVSIQIPKNSEDSEKYSGILFSYQNKGDNGAGSLVQKKAATLFFVRIGHPNEQGNFTAFSAAPSMSFSGAVSFDSAFQNTGNVHLVPQGNVRIYNMFGKLVGSTQFNRDALFVMPQTTRDFKSGWKSNTAFGYYTAVAQIYYGDSNLETQAKTVFWVFPLKLIVLVLVLLVALVLGFIYGLRAYKRFIINKARKNNLL